MTLVFWTAALLSVATASAEEPGKSPRGDLNRRSATLVMLAGSDDRKYDSPVLRFAHELAASRTIRAKIRHDGSDAYRFSVSENGAIDVESGSERGVLYAVYDVLDGKKSGDEAPAFSIRGLFPCDCTQRHTPAMMRKLIDRMGRWRMNTLPIITHIGFREHEDLILHECAKRGIDIVHYTYYQLAFCEGIPRKYFAVDNNGNPRPPYDWLETTDRLCASNPEGLKLYRQGVRRYFREHPDRRKLLFATPDGKDYCQCKACRKLVGPVGQMTPFFDIFMEESQGKGLWREYLVYYQRYRLPKDMSWVHKTDAIMFDTHTRNPRFPLHDPEMKAGEDLVHKYIDPRAKNSTRNRYLFDRLLEWRTAYSGKIYIHENMMIQGCYGVPKSNTRIYLEDLRQFEKAGIDGVVYEAFEPGIRPFLPMLDVLAKALWNPLAEYEICDDTCTELQEFFGLVHQYRRQQDWASCRNLIKYVLDRPDRDQFDWLYIGYNSMKTVYRRKPLPNLTDEEREFVTKRKLWDFMEGRPNAREVTGRLIEQITRKLE